MSIPIGDPFAIEGNAGGFYADRTDDRRRDHRHPGRDRDPAYQDYTVRSKVAEGINMAGAAETTVAEGWQTGDVAGLAAAAASYSFVRT